MSAGRSAWIFYKHEGQFQNNIFRKFPREFTLPSELKIMIAVVNLMFIGPCVIVIVEEWKTNSMSLAILFHFLCAQHVSDINISIIRSLRLCCWITTSVVLFSVRCVLEIWCLCCSCASAYNTDTTQNQPHQISNTQRTENNTTDVVIQQHSRKLLMMDILMSEKCWARKKWNKIASDIKLVFHSSTGVKKLGAHKSLKLFEYLSDCKLLHRETFPLS